MAGHSKWANIKRKKGAVDAKRGKLFTKLVKEIMTAARLGGGDSSSNPRLRAAVAEAKSNSLPAENIARAIKKAIGELAGAEVMEITYEGYGPGGVAFVVEAQTDNRNRTSAEVRGSFSKFGGNLGTTGSVGWMFKRCGRFVFDASKYPEDQIMEVALEAGAQDVSTEEEEVVVLSAPEDFAAVLNVFEDKRIEYKEAKLVMIPENSIKIEGDVAGTVIKLFERLDDLDDVMTVYANFDISDEELSRLEMA
jgi:YebC/PmpR family DNA-binding regulatory protein